MNRNRNCPKCQSTDFVTARRGHTSLFLSFLRSIEIKTLVCVDCGQIEEFIPQDQLDKLRSHGKRVA